MTCGSHTCCENYRGRCFGDGCDRNPLWKPYEQEDEDEGEKNQDGPEYGELRIRANRPDRMG